MFMQIEDAEGNWPTDIQYHKPVVWLDWDLQALVSRMNGKKIGSSLEEFMDTMKNLPDKGVYEVGHHL